MLLQVFSIKYVGASRHKLPAKPWDLTSRCATLQAAEWKRGFFQYYGEGWNENGFLLAVSESVFLACADFTSCQRFLGNVTFSIFTLFSFLFSFYLYLQYLRQTDVESTRKTWELWIKVVSFLATRSEHIFLLVETTSWSSEQESQND